MNHRREGGQLSPDYPTDTEVQAVKENQVVIGYGAGMNQYRLVVYKVDHTKNGFIYHLINLETKEFTSTEIIDPLTKKFGIGNYFDDINPEFMDAFEVVVLRQEVESKVKVKAEADYKEQQCREENKFSVTPNPSKNSWPPWADALINTSPRTVKNWRQTLNLVFVPLAFRATCQYA